MSRIDELSSNLSNLRLEIQSACERVNREPEEITLIAVTKNFPTEDIRMLHDLGVSDFGESKAQEFSKKYESLSGLVATWHFIGQVQSNKINNIARISDVVHSIDSAKQIEKFNQAAFENGKVLELLIQINLDPDYPNLRGGVSPSDAEHLAELIHRLRNVTLGGLMFIASPKLEPKVAFSDFSRVAKDFQLEHPSAIAISAGMSSDIQEAIAFGATHLRIGSKLLGNRPL